MVRQVLCIINIIGGVLQLVVRLIDPEKLSDAVYGFFNSCCAFCTKKCAQLKNFSNQCYSLLWSSLGQNDHMPRTLHVSICLFLFLLVLLQFGTDRWLLWRFARADSTTQWTRTLPAVMWSIGAYFGWHIYVCPRWESNVGDKLIISHFWSKHFTILMLYEFKNVLSVSVHTI